MLKHLFNNFPSGDFVIAISNVFGPLNKGDWELFSRLVYLLKEQFPNQDIAAIARDKEITEENFSFIEVGEQIGKANLIGALGRIQIIFYLFMALVSVKFKPFEVFLPKQQRKSLDILRRASLVIACPGGFLEDSSKSYLTHLAQLVIAVWLGKKIVLAPMSIGPINGYFSKFLIRYVLRRATKIFVRELYSKSFVESLGVACILSDDLAFLLINEIKPECFTSKKWIACTVIEWNFPLAEDRGAARANYIAALTDALNKMQDRFGLDIYFIRQVSSDISAILDVAKNIKGGYFIGEEKHSPRDVIEILCASKVVLASRFHSFIFSMAARCPGVAISYLPKTSGMLKMYDMEGQCLDIYSLKSTDLISAVDNACLDSASYNEKINKIGGQVKFSSRLFITELSKIIEA